MNEIKIKSETYANRCEICHQADKFDPVTLNCTRCLTLNNLKSENSKLIVFELSDLQKTLLGKELTENEKVLWVGKKAVRRRFLELFQVVIGFVVTTISISVFLLADVMLGNSTPLKPILYISGFLLFIVLLLNLYDYYTTYYLITNKRAIILNFIWRHQIEMKSYYPNNFKNLTKRTRIDGSSDLIFDKIKNKSRKGPRIIEFGFFGIDQVDKIEEMLVGLKKE